MIPEEFINGVQCRIKRREYEAEGRAGNVLSGLSALPGYISKGKQVTLYLECGWCLIVTEGYSGEFRDYILSKPGREHHLTEAIPPSATHVRCPFCSGDFWEPN